MVGMNNYNSRQKATFVEMQHAKDSSRVNAVLHAVLGGLLELGRARTFSDICPLTAWWRCCVTDTWTGMKVFNCVLGTKSAFSSHALNA